MGFQQALYRHASKASTHPSMQQTPNPVTKGTAHSYVNTQNTNDNHTSLEKLTTHYVAAKIHKKTFFWGEECNFF